MRLVQEAAARMDVPTVVFNQREAHLVDVSLSVGDGSVGGWLEVRGTRYPLESFTGAFVRLMDPRELPELQPRGRRPPDPTQVRKSALVHDYLGVWLEYAPCRVLNRNAPAASNGSKPYQAALIRAAGFPTPETLVTTDPAEARAFIREHPRSIYKSTSAVRSIVREVTADRLADLDRIRNLATQFQAYVPGTNVRVHVVGDRTFAHEVATSAVDYRYAGREDLAVEMRSVDLPATVAERCVALARSLDLPLCGIDLKRTPDEVYYCFEVNPSPAFSYYQEQTGQPIADAIVAYLAATPEEPQQLPTST
jgi:glutathione synthase/RimK-type ligase-like ATP-grasp enzyme